MCNLDVGQSVIMGLLLFVMIVGGLYGTVKFLLAYINLRNDFECLAQAVRNQRQSSFTNDTELLDSFLSGAFRLVRGGELLK